LTGAGKIILCAFQRRRLNSAASESLFGKLKIPLRDSQAKAGNFDIVPRTI
jgi:hypothetical protein